MPKSKNIKSNVFDAKSYLKPGLTVNEISEIKEAFDYFDAEGVGEMSVKELLTALKKYGFNTQNPEIYEIVAEMDTEGTL